MIKSCLLPCGAGLLATVSLVAQPFTHPVYDTAFVTTVADYAADNPAEVDATRFGAAGTLPQAAFLPILAEKFAQGTAGVVNFESFTAGEPWVVNDTPITYTNDSETDPANVFASLTVTLPGGTHVIKVTQGENNRKEASNGSGIPTAEGMPGEPDLNAAISTPNGNFFSWNISDNSGSNLLPLAEPASGSFTLVNPTFYHFAFDAADEVTLVAVQMSNIEYYQHYNPGGVAKMFARATYSDGSSVVQSSNELDQAPEGTLDHFYAFEAPAGTFITGLEIWAIGNNSRVLAWLDDLAIGVAGSTDYELTTSVSPSPSAGTVTGSGTFAPGSAATLTATPEEGYELVGWAYEGNETHFFSNASTVEVPMNGSKDVVAVFDVTGAYTIDLADQQPAGASETVGTVSLMPLKPSYDENDVVTLNSQVTAGLENYYRFKEWQVNGNVVSTDPAYQYTVSGADTTVEIVGVFEAMPYVVLLRVRDTNNRVIPDLDINSYVSIVDEEGDGSPYLGDETVTFTLDSVPAGYRFVEWISFGTSVSTEMSVDFVISPTGNLSKDLSVVLQAVAQVSLVTPSNGTIAMTPEETQFDVGTSVEFSASPDEGYAFVGWTGDATGTMNPLTLVLTEDVSIGAQFAALFDLTVNSQGDGSVTLSPDSSNYVDGTEVELTAVPAAGSLFRGWMGDAAGVANPLSITMDADKVITATFSAAAAAPAFGEVNIETNPIPGSEFSYTLPVTDGEGPLSFSVTEGTLPAGMTLNAETGELSGVATAFGSFPLTIEVQDALGRVDSVSITLLVQPGDPFAKAQPVPDETDIWELPWLGYFYMNAAQPEWIYSYTLGWIYVSASGEGSFWGYAFSSTGWLYLSEFLWPYVYGVDISGEYVQGGDFNSLTGWLYWDAPNGLWYDLTDGHQQVLFP